MSEPPTAAALAELETDLAGYRAESAEADLKYRQMVDNNRQLEKDLRALREDRDALRARVAELEAENRDFRAALENDDLELDLSGPIIGESIPVTFAPPRCAPPLTFQDDRTPEERQHDAAMPELEEEITRLSHMVGIKDGVEEIYRIVTALTYDDLDALQAALRGDASFLRQGSCPLCHHGIDLHSEYGCGYGTALNHDETCSCEKKARQTKVWETEEHTC